jgi:dihydrofolate reductase
MGITGAAGEGNGPVVISAAVSLDGRLADGAGGVGWLDPYPASDFGFDQFIAGVGGVIMGRRSFEAGRKLGPWPYGALPVTVMTHRPLETALPTLQGFEGSVADAIAQMRARAGGAIWLMGGGEIFAQALAARSVDRIDLAIIPVVLGAGPLWAPEGNSQGALQAGFKLATVETKPGGAVRYIMERA